MSKKREKRTEILPYIRLTPSEKKAIIAEYKATKYPNRAAYIRAKLLEKTTFRYKEKVLDAEIAAGKLVTELNRLGNNINQIAKVLNTYKDGKMRQEELMTIATTAKLLLQIKQILTQDDSEN
ncbi:MAG: plasmid mobilization relaxosome protein MobC [Bacteroidota bacterium]